MFLFIYSATVNQEYKFAVLEPSIEGRTDKIQRFRFKINQTVNKWIAFGLCHINTISDKNFIWKGLIKSGFYCILAYNGNSFSHYFF